MKNITAKVETHTENVGEVSDDEDFNDILAQLAQQPNDDSSDEDVDMQDDKNMGTLEFSDDEDDDGDALGMWDVSETPTRPGNLHKVDPMVDLAVRPQHSCCDVRGDLVFPADEAVPAETSLADKARWRVPKVPSSLERRCSNHSGIFVSVDYSESNINGTDEEREIDIALDSGAVDHVICTDLLPATSEISEVTGTRVGKSFVAANGQAMKTFGECILECADRDGTCLSSFAVTEVSRALQSVSRICDQDLEVLFTKTEAKVRDPRTGKFVARYARRGGLYTRTVKVKPGVKPSDDRRKKAQPFTRPSTKR